MTTVHDRQHVGPDTAATPTLAARILLALLRISIGWYFLWAFLDKTFGLGFATEREAAWIDGGSPTTGYLTHGTSGPFADFYQSLAGYTAVDWLFMVGLLGIGVAMILGIGMRIAGVSAALMLFFMWTAALWPTTNPFMDDHLIMGVAALALAATYAGRYFGLGQVWERLSLVQQNRWLV